jgi:hypothetical protein
VLTVILNDGSCNMNRAFPGLLVAPQAEEGRPYLLAVNAERRGKGGS